jgi:site-specific DNA recombinase
MSSFPINEIPFEADQRLLSGGRKKATILLRVSSLGQVRTDYDPEGLSLPAQRAACERKARELGADVVREYVEPGVSAKALTSRKAFKKMIEEIRERGDIDYVIVWSVSRWARNQEDHWTARGIINRAGAKLISVKEPIGEDTSHGVMIEGVMAAVAESRRIEISEDATRGMQRKVEVGGKPGPAPLGYLNVGEPLPQGGEVRTIAVDKPRAEIIVWAFEAYATGAYSLLDIVTLLEARGLRTRGNARYSSRPLRLSAVHALLSNPFYAGKVRYKGKLYKGRHTAVISEELFDRVQAVLEAHNKSGERDRRHQHYLKGTIRCGRCNHRLTYSLNRGNGGAYSYFICGPSQRRECDCGYMRMEDVEAKIEDHYRSIRLKPATRERVVALVEKRIAALAATSNRRSGGARRCSPGSWRRSGSCSKSTTPTRSPRRCMPRRPSASSANVPTPRRSSTDSASAMTSSATS